MEEEDQLFPQSVDLEDGGQMLKMIKQVNSDEKKSVSTSKHSSTETNDIESDNQTQIISSSSERDGFKKLKTKTYKPDLQNSEAFNILQKRKHLELDKMTEMEDLDSLMINENDSTQHYGELTRKLMKVSSQFNSYLDENVYKKQMVSYTPICLLTPEVEEQKKNFVAYYSKHFSNDEISKVFSSNKDMSVVQCDTPERYQLLLGSFIEKQMTDEVMNHLVKWIYCNLYLQDATSIDNIPIETIEHILKLIIYQKMEVPTIFNNEKNFIPKVSLSLLWSIFNLLITYKEEIYFPRSRNEEVTIEMYSIRQISDVISQYMNVAQNKNEFSDIYLHLNYLKCCFDIKLRANSDIQANHLKFINQAREHNIPTQIYSFFDDSSCCAEALFPKIAQLNPFINIYGWKQSSSKQTLTTKMLDSVELQTEEDLMTLLIKGYSSMTQTEKTNISELVQEYICLDYFYNPVVKKYISEVYLKHAVLSTSPLAHVIGFNIYHEYFSAKKIIQKPLSEVRSEEYLTIQSAVQQNLIDCKIQLPWQINRSEDLILKEMSLHFQSQLASKSEVLKQYISNILSKLLKNYLYPYAQSEMRRILEERSLIEIRNTCVSKFKEYISYGHYLMKDRQDQLVKPETILSFFVNEMTGMVGISMLSQEGKEVYKNCIEYYFNTDKLVAQKREQEIKNLYDFIRNRQPQVIIISSNSTRALVLKSNLYIQFKNFCRNILMVEQTMMNCYLQQSSFIQSPKDKYIFLARKQAKSFQFRLQEVCSLWNYENNPILELKFHPFQAIQDRICSDGLEFKQLFDKTASYKDFLQFIPGFGPRKAFFFLSWFEPGKKDPKEVTSRQKCINLNLMAENLLMSSLTFLKFSKSEDPLDSTLIPYNQYFIVKSIIESLELHLKNENTLLTNPEESDKNSASSTTGYTRMLKVIKEKPELLSKVDLLDYSKTLDKTYCKQNMIISLDKIVLDLTNMSKVEQASLVAPDLTMKQIFESIYTIHPNCLRKGAQLILKYREVTEKYIEFSSKDHKIRCRLMKSDIPKGLSIEKFFEKKRSAEIELVLDSVRVFDNPSENIHQIDNIFDNKVSFNYPKYEDVVTEIVTEYMQPNPYFGELDSSDIPSTRVDLKTQFNVFSKEMEKNPYNVIDLTEETVPSKNYPNQQQQQFDSKQQSSSSSSWGNTSQQNSTNNNNNNNNSSSWGASTTTQNTSSSSSWGQTSAQTNNNNSNNASSSWGDSNSTGNNGDGWNGGDSNVSNSTEQPLRQRGGDFNNSSFRKPYNRNNNSNSFSGGDNSSQQSTSTPSWGNTSNNNSSNDKPLRNRENTTSFDSNNNTGGEWGSTSNDTSNSTGGGGWGNNNDNKQTSSSSGGWGSSTNNQKTPSNEGGGGSGWGSNVNKSPVVASSSGGWGSSNSNVQTNSTENGGGWGASSSSSNNDNSGTGGSGWGGNTSSSSNAWGNSNNSGQGNSDNGGGWNSGGGDGGSSDWGASSSTSNFGQNSGRDRNQNGGNGGNRGKGCFKCGKEGHMSKDCTEPSQQKKGCFKCGKEGHMSRECTEPQQQGRRQGGGGGACFKCNQEGHMSKDCPNSQQQKKGCFKCGEEGHMSKECPNPQKQKSACFKCGQEGHMSRECPNPPQQRQGGNSCFKCKQEGHMSRECPNSTGGGGGGGNKCFNCNQEGHMSKDCPNPSQRKKGCFNCGEEGHQSRECTKERKERPPRNNNGNSRNNSSFGGGSSSFGGDSGAWGASSGGGNAWGSSTDESQGQSSGGGGGGWGSSTTQSDNNSSSNNGWGSSSTTNTNNGNGGGWGSSDSNNATTTTSGGWGTTQKTSSGEKGGGNNNSSWGSSNNNNTNNGGGW